MSDTGATGLVRAAARLGPRRPPSSAPGRPALPRLWLVTDPDRTPDPVALAERLPRGAGVIHRTFGRAEATAQAAPLAGLCHARGLVLLIGADAGLAAAVEAAGVHLPERDLRLARRIRARRPGWVVTVAAHSGAALARAGRAGADAALLSAVFRSASASAGAPLGVIRFARLVRDATLPVYALGGVDAMTVRRLRSTGAAGFAAVDAFRT